jgi:hypothetical protein
MTAGRVGRSHNVREFAAMSGFRRRQPGKRTHGWSVISPVKTTEKCDLQVFMERAGIEPATSGLQSSAGPSGLRRPGRGLQARAGLSSVTVRGSPSAVGVFRRPRAGCARDEFVAWLQNRELVEPSDNFESLLTIEDFARRADQCPHERSALQHPGTTVAPAAATVFTRTLAIGARDEALPVGPRERRLDGRVPP